MRHINLQHTICETQKMPETIEIKKDATKKITLQESETCESVTSKMRHWG